EVLVVAVEEAAELVAVDRVVGGVEVQDDPRSGGLGWAWRKRVTKSRSTSWVRQGIFLYRVSASAPVGDSSRRLRVLLPANALPRSRGRRRVLPVGSSLPTTVAIKGSRRRSS